MKASTIQSKGYRLRPFTFEDAPEVVAIFQKSATAVLGQPDTDLEDMLREWQTPGFDVDDCVRVLVDSEDHIIAYVDLYDPEKPHVVKWAWVDMDPEHWDDALALELLNWAEDTARQRIALAPEGAKVVLSYGAVQQAENQNRMLEAAGFDLVRHYFRMEMEMPDKLPAPTCNGFRIRPMVYPDEFSDLIQASAEAFRDHWGFVERDAEENLKHWQHYVDNDPLFDPSLWLFAMHDDQIAGICFCRSGLTEDPDLGWISQLAVLRPYRRKGLGSTLLQAGFNTLYEAGKRKVGLTVDSASLTNATRLYEKAGMHILRQYNTYHKELRPGKDLGTQAIA